MKHLSSYANVALFLILLFLFLIFLPHKELSTNLISLLPQNKETKLLKIYEKFNASKEILVAIKGEDFKKIKELEKRILKNDFLELKKSVFNNKEFRTYLKKYRYYLQHFDKDNPLFIEKKLQEAYTNLSTNPYYGTIDKHDPLELFTPRKKSALVEVKNGHMYLKDYGYMSVFSFKDGVSFQKVYDVFEQEMQTEVKIFSPIFYFVENEKAIKAEVNLLIFIALTLLFILYIVILKNIALLFNTILTLISASMLSLLVITFIWDDISIFVMVFGVSISTIAIDYMFHNYFSGFYEKKSGFNKPVFFGFLSTFIAFGVFSFIQFPFIKQVSTYTVISLLFSYLVFSFLFPKIGFTLKNINIVLPSFNIVRNYKYFLYILFIFIAFSLFQINLDLNIKNLDYQNTKLQKQESFFKSKLDTQEKIPFIIKATSIDSLIEKSKTFQALHVDALVPLANLITLKEFEKRKTILKSVDFSNLRKKINFQAQDIGFRKDFFQDAYSKKLLFPSPPTYERSTLEKYGFDIFFDGKEYYSFGLINKDKKVEEVYLLDANKLFEKSLKAVYTQLVISGFIIFFSIVFILYKATDKHFYKALSYVIFPLACILFFISFESINILQIFMLLIITALSIDYGIYMSQTQVTKSSKKAVLFSLVSTFAGFGVLIFSSIGVLFYIGEVAVLGLFAILLLMLSER